MLALQRLTGAGIAMIRTHADGAFTQIDQNAPALLPHALHDGIEIAAALAENIVQHILAMETDRHFLAVANIAEDNRHVLHRLPRQFD